MASNETIKKENNVKEEIKVDKQDINKTNKESKIDRRPKRKKPGFHEEMFEETKYYFKKGK